MLNNKNLIVLLSILSFVLLIECGIDFLTTDNDIPFEQIAVYEYTEEIIDAYEKSYSNYEEIDAHYYTIYSDRFHNYSWQPSDSMLEPQWADYSPKIFQKAYNINEICSDTERYTYIISPSHQLLKMQYNRISDWAIIRNKRIVTKMYFDLEYEEKLYIYRIETMYIGYDYDDPDNYIYYIDTKDCNNGVINYEENID